MTLCVLEKFLLISKVLLNWDQAKIVFLKNNCENYIPRWESAFGARFSSQEVK